MTIHKKLVEYALDDVERAISGQQVSIQNLRIRTSHVLTLNGIVLSLFASRIVRPPADEAQTVDDWFQIVSLTDAIAIGAAFFAVVFALIILVPRSGWIFSNDSSKFLERFVFDGVVPDEVLVFAEIIEMRQGHYRSNESTLSSLYSCLFFSVVLTFVHILFWMAGLIL